MTSIIALGGFEGSNPFNSAEVFSTATQNWTALPNMTTRRSDHAACAVNKTKLIACGGRSGSVNVFLSSCETLDLINQNAGWKLIANMSTVRSLSSGTLLPDGKAFLMIGGYNGISPSPLASCEKLDIATNTWSSVADLSLGGRYSHCSVL